ncbi:DNA glycosylase [Pseudoduganella ginsengisoli]|uniref:DNA-3-methyladenine glycosylase II n=1 Tax=Pseudoduganella ginsengisoli TaxID=1462440 RepID=A0A6L6PSW9_9BURK|nr:AlkA N-terminal domain-containing protein [Pseudoduganella ginsengisoli]MTW00555.1 DNA-3-methyladenine glycosylase 2 [Pseudoduganella ginsengisoli]
MAWDIALPDGYRLHDVLAFHQRDAENVAEHVTPQRLRKAVVLAGTPVLLDVAFEGAVARCSALADGEPTDAVDSAIRGALRNVLGLRIDPQPFTDMVAGDPVMGPLAKRQPGLRIVQSATVFEALTWAVIGQQINLAFAIALRRTLIQLAGPRHSGGLWCYPDAAGVARLSVDDLTSRKFSRAKAETLLRLSALVADGALDLEPGPANTIADISEALLAVKGIGPWTVNYGLLRGYGYEDCSLHGDVAIRTALQPLLGGDERPDIAATERFLQRYAPHRTMAAAHLWASLHPRGDGNG